MEFDYGTYGYIATKDLNRAKKNLEIEEYSVCGFYSQQCLEKIGKQYLQLTGTGGGGPLDNKTHKLKKVFSTIDLSGVPKAVEAIYILTDCYFDSRYPGNDYFELTAKPAREYFEATVQIYDYICTLIEQYTKDNFKPTENFD